MKLNHLLYSIAVLTLTSCAEDVTVDISKHDGIVFGVDVSGLDQSRGTSSQTADHFRLCNDTDSVDVTSTVEDICTPALTSRATPAETFSSFRAWAYLHEAGTTKTFFTNEPVSDKGAYWATAQTYYWPTSDTQKLSFVALAGISDEGMTINSQSGIFSLTYTVAANAAAQPDVMFASTEPVNGSGDPNYRVPLNFKHICSAVRFRTGSTMIPGRINKITLKGVKSTGTFSNGAWSEVSGSQSFSIATPVATTGNETAGQALYPDDQTFMFIPQTLGSDTQLEVEFYDNVSAVTRTLSASLAGQNWPMGKITTYSIGITAPGILEFTETTPPVQDAHYIIFRTSVRAENLEGHSWRIEASADDGANVSVQLASEANEYARDHGFWTDVEATNNVPGTKSARGTASFTNSSTGELPILVFLPENISDKNRTITLKLYRPDYPSDTKELTIIQSYPAWSGSLGWEQFQEDKPQQFGFNWTRKTSYQFVYSVLNLPSEGKVAGGHYKGSEIRAIMDNLQNLYNAKNYTSVEHAFYNVNRRIYLYFDYSRLNSISAENPANGLTNTLKLASGRSAFTGLFEYALLNTRKTEDGKEGEPLFRENYNGDGDKYNYDMPMREGNSLEELQDCALSTLLKKNRYYLNTTSSNGATTIAPYIAEENIKWFMPAKDQFNQKPATIIDPIATDAWSSTAASTSTQYLGNGTPVSRSTEHNIRACRMRE